MKKYKIVKKFIYWKYKMHSNFSKHTAVFLLIFSVFCFKGFSQEDVSKKNMTDFESLAIEKTFEFRLSLGALPEPLDAVPLIEEYSRKVNDTEFASKISEEVLLCINNMLVWEKYNALFEDDINNKEIEKLIKDRYEVVKAFQKTHKKETHCQWFYTSSGDILSCCMQFLSIPTAMSEGLTIKGFYDDAVEMNPDFVFGLNNLAQWYFYAPFFAGGSESKAQKLFKHSFEVSKTLPERYYTALLLSQSYFESKDYDKCKELIDYADEIFPNTRAVKLHRMVNDLGYSIFKYTTDRKKIDKKLREKNLIK